MATDLALLLNEETVKEGFRTLKKNRTPGQAP
jgi:hypothetical protein